jgi:hypothetical protein
VNKLLGCIDELFTIADDPRLCAELSEKCLEVIIKLDTVLQEGVISFHSATSDVSVRVGRKFRDS